MTEDDYLPLSAVERYTFCVRQAYLFHREGARADNRFTVEGSAIHARVISAEDERRGRLTITRSIPVVSHRLRVIGVADVVEFRGGMIVPVEYKRGGAKGRPYEWAQVCLQAICLEEMLSTSIPQAHIYHHATHRREAVPLTDALRAETERAVEALHCLLTQSVPPPPVVAPHCERCSLQGTCLPSVSQRRSAQEWFETRLGQREN